MPTKIRPAPGSKRAKTKKTAPTAKEPAAAVVVDEKPRSHKTHLQLRYDFNLEETKELGLQAARAIREADDLESTRKNIVAQYANDIKVARARASSISAQITSGYEMRMVECDAYLNQPIEGLKLVCRTDKDWPDCVVRVDKMLAHEMQESMPLDDKVVDILGSVPPEPPPADPDSLIPDPEEEEEED
jgi:hypothetical protein